MASDTKKKVLFYGDHDLTVDKKNRLMIPSDVRVLLSPKIHGNAFFATLRNKVLWLYPEKSYEDLYEAQIPADIRPNKKQLDFIRLTLSSASRLEWDGQGRVLLPEKLLKRAEIDKEVSLIGAGDHLELWRRQDWLVEQDRLFAESDAIENGPETAPNEKQMDRPSVSPQ